MASEFKIEEQDRDPYEQSVNEPGLAAEEKEMRAAITKWARIKQPTGAAWIYIWNKPSEKTPE